MYNHKELKVPTRLPISSGRPPEAPLGVASRPDYSVGKFEVPPARRAYASERAKDEKK